MQDATISFVITTSLPVVGGGWGQARGVADCEAEKCSRR